MRIGLQILIVAICIENQIYEKSNFTVTFTTNSKNVEYDLPVIGHLINPLSSNFFVDVTVKNNQNISKNDVVLIIQPKSNPFCEFKEKQEILGFFNPNESKTFTFPLGEGPMNCQISFDYNLSSN
jgi:hypothetical protein